MGGGYSVLGSLHSVPGGYCWSHCVGLAMVRVLGESYGGSIDVLLFIFCGRRGIVGYMVPRLGLPRRSYSLLFLLFGLVLCRGWRMFWSFFRFSFCLLFHLARGRGVFSLFGLPWFVCFGWLLWRLFGF